MKLDKILITLGIACTLTASAASYQVKSFINDPWVGIRIPKATTITYDQSNAVAYIPVMTYNAQQFASSQTFVTNSAINPLVSLQCATNFAQFLTVNTNAVGGYTAPHFIDVRNTADSVGDVQSNQALSLTWSGDGAAATNIITFNFIKSASAGRFYDTNTIYSLSFSNYNGLTTVVTNVASWFVTGSDRIRLQSVVAGANTVASTNYIHEINLGGFVP